MEQNNIKSAPSAVQKVEVVENPLMRKIQLPGNTYRLPSKGIFYKNGELAEHVIDGEVEVFPMKSIDEINLKTPDMIFQGSAIRRVFERCIPDIKLPMQLLAQDVDFLLACLREVSYGEFFTISMRCDCTGNKREYNIPINTFTVKNTTELDEKNIEKEYKYVLEIPNGETQSVQFKPMTYASTIQLLQFQATKLDTIPDTMSASGILDDKSSDEIEDIISDFFSISLSASIVEVDGITDIGQIKEWIMGIDVRTKQKLIDKLNTFTPWGTEFKYEEPCVDCGKMLDLSPMIDPVSFFI